MSTNIEWTDETWNPIRGCSRVSEGCRNCYAERQAARFSGPGMPYEGLVKRTSHGPAWTGEVHHLRHRALTDAHRQGKDAQALGGHADPRMTAQYIERAEVSWVDPPDVGVLS